MRIINQTQNSLLASNAVLAARPIDRMIGLLKRSSLFPGEGMVITSCRSIHMFFMRFAIDVVFVDRNNIVVGLVHDIKPFCLSPYFWRASAAIELPSGTIKKTKTQLGDHLSY